jgi:tagatose 1,6-diphosphate aldolase GatY/KbaY
MPYTSSKDMLEAARVNNYAVCAFNAENLEMVQAIIWGAEEMRAPVIIQTTPSTVKYTDGAYFAAIVKTAAESSTIPVALHLDHGNSFALVCRAVKAGYTSIMIDGSQEPFEENIALTQKVIELAHTIGIPVEAELGKVGGKEDDLESETAYADPFEARDFVERTRCDSLAVGIGTAHGIYKNTPKLDLDRLSEIKKLVDVPLVLHGATGLSDNIIKECVERGINKINYATELRQVYTNAVREKLSSDASIIDGKIYSGYARNCVRERVKEKIKLAGKTF